MNRAVRYALALGFAGGAIFHAIALIWPEIGSPSPPWRHALFVAINLFFAASMVRPPRWLIVPAAILIAQQAYGHGRDLVGAWQNGHLDIQSLVTLVSLPFLGYVAIAAFAPFKDSDRSRR